MTWRERLKQGRYTGADGGSIEFEFEDLSKVIPKKTKAHDFPSVNATYVEDQGIRGRRFPMRVFFSGPDHDIAADTFENLLVQRGAGRLQHPLYGNPDVIAFGDITREDNVKSSANQTVFTLTFYETIAALYPANTGDLSGTLQVAIATDDVQSQFAESVDLGTPGERANFFAALRAIVGGTRRALARAADASQRLTLAQLRAQRALDRSIALGIGTPLGIARQLRNLVEAPARSTALLSDRLNAYRNLAAGIFSGRGAGEGAGVGDSEGTVSASVINPGVDSTEANAFQLNNLVAQSSVFAMTAGAALPVEDQGFTSRDGAIAALDTLLDTYESYVQWADSNYAAIAAASGDINPLEPVASGKGSTDTGEAGAALRTAVLLATEQLQRTALLLPPRLVYVVVRPRTPLDLCAQLYQSLDFLDDFFEANDFSGDEIFELPVGRRVVYFPRLG